MTRIELKQEADILKEELIYIIKRYYHKNETIDENLRKYNKFFGIPVSKEDVEYLISNKDIRLDEVNSLNEYISRRICNKHKRSYINVFKPLMKYSNKKIPDDVKQYIKDTFDKKLNKLENYNLYIKDENNYKLSYQSYLNILKVQRKPKLFFYI